MKTRRLGNSELLVSEISLGSWLTLAGGIARETARSCVRAALDCGIQFFDTANQYGAGAAEQLLGEALAEIPRGTYLLATKLYFPVGDEPGQGLSAAQVSLQLDRSLQRLRTDYVDLYQCHRYDAGTPLEETMAALTRAVEAGKVRFIGFSEWSAAQIDRAAALSGTDGLASFVSSQPNYSLLWRKPEAEVFAACARHGIGNLAYSPLAQGVLTGKYRPGAPPPADSRAANDSMNQFLEVGQRRFRSGDLLAAVEQVVPIAAELGLSLSQFALAWVLRRPEIASAITGASRPEQVRQNAAASGVVLPPEAIARAEAILGLVTVFA